VSKSFDTRHGAAEFSPGFLLWKVANLHQRLQRRALVPFDLTPTQFSILACYADLARLQPEFPPTQAEVCVHGALDKMIVSDATRALATKGLIETTKNAQDKRTSVVVLTADGMAVLNQAIAVVETLDETLFSRTRNLNRFVADLQLVLADEPNELPPTKTLLPAKSPVRTRNP
jgi:MarR family transcriptional regulator, organic hydroperoxide resistance regulator